MESRQPRAKKPKRKAGPAARSAASAVRKRKPAAKKRGTRRSASEARTRILEAAQRELMRVGPEALRLTDLARQLEVSHPAILHHFGSREGLIAAVVGHSLSALSEQLTAALRGGTRVTERLDLVEMVAEVCGEGGLGRLLAWLLLSGQDSKLQTRTQLPIKQLADTAHMLRARFGHPAAYEDTLFEVQLLAIVLLGEAIFGDAVWRASGDRDASVAARNFRRRLTGLLPQ